MNFLANPTWLKQFQYPYTSAKDIPKSVFEEINQNLDRNISTDPVVSIVIAAWNEEVNILRCIASLSKLKSSIPFEIIVVNNNSTDQTQSTLDQLHIKSFFEKVQGCGPARQLGQENALGKYILMGDADCLYPDCWLDEMISILSQPEVVCVYGRYSFISEPGYPRWKLSIFELMKDIIAEFRHVNRPYFNAYGMSMGYIKEYGLKVGFIKVNRRGEDGQLCLDLMKYGKIKQVKAKKARTWTGIRTLMLDGSISGALIIRLFKELKRFFYNLHSRLPENKKPEGKS
ncbi:MAG: glycosyl transferase [Sphingobacteriales bacterium 17-39-43]|uniref:glycosyltransferase family 2 protein n=1 Tax=Daejeonella sp. TaxID=2805397 RepID=UPI000BC728BC|nr:glycosyltransferase family 2 protein [Daejeonella sp.]OYZ30889.1 MAG: glycosyl transferase [Sphingobacteriales bacterium 16-39-50]OYZ52687.1 MAG: glycosyl transferase [Sphingobacteriales bacterium 24-40-4]OZA23675.1 MAG: glycosyl transferase [Sphingobacteriales bacterium 17-39-43]HQS06319.1 glycosyltransferase family 2 protein [Daejeonella sp.]HQT23458.1 glycosyltransferase family 2 protein [Daejeonella sp.]